MAAAAPSSSSCRTHCHANSASSVARLPDTPSCDSNSTLFLRDSMSIRSRPLSDFTSQTVRQNPVGDTRKVCPSLNLSVPTPLQRRFKLATAAFEPSSTATVVLRQKPMRDSVHLSPCASACMLHDHKLGLLSRATT